MQTTIYLLNGVMANFLDLTLQNQDVTPLLITMPASWNQPRSRYRATITGTFQLNQPGDLFIRKFWIGDTPITQANAQAIRPQEARGFRDVHEMVFYGDNLHGIYSIHNTGLVSCGSFTMGEGNSATTDKFRGAFPATQEASFSDTPLIENWNRISFSFFATAQDKTVKIGYSIRDVVVEKIDLT